MADFFDTFYLEKICALRAATSSGKVENNVHLSSGFYVSWDEEESDAQINYDSPDWAMLTLDWDVSGTPRWFSLNLSLGEGILDSGDIIALVSEGYADTSLALSLTLRSKIEDEVFDVDWDDAVELHPENGINTVLRRIEIGDQIGGRSAYHTLILTLPAQNNAVTLRNLRTFRIPASKGLRCVPETLSSLAV